HTRFSRDWSSDVCSSDHAPAVEAAAVLPHRADDLADAPVAARQQALDDGRLPVVVPQADGAAVLLVAAQGVPEGAQAAVDGLVVALRGPLERGVRLGHEPADRHGAADVLAAGGLAPRLDDPPGRAGDRE